MKEFFYKSIAVFMATVVLITTMSFTIDMHYCGEKMIDYSFFSKAETCGMEKMQVASTCQSKEISKKSCCTDKLLIIEGQDELKLTFNKLTFEQQIFVASFTYSYINLFEGTTFDEVPFVDYPPPFVEQDVQVLHQTFLI